jgi:hypothetical protein
MTEKHALYMHCPKWWVRELDKVAARRGLSRAALIRETMALVLDLKPPQESQDQEQQVQSEG